MMQILSQCQDDSIMLMIRSLKKYCHKSSLVRFLASFREWPLVRLYVENSNKVPNSIDDNLWIILNTSIYDQLWFVYLLSKDHKFSCLSLSSYRSSLTEGIILVNLLRTFSMSILSFL